LLFFVTGYCSYAIFNRTDTTLLFTTINYSLKLNNLASQDTSFKVSVKTYTYTCYRSFYNAIYIEYIRDTYSNKEAIYCTRRVWVVKCKYDTTTQHKSYINNESNYTAKVQL